MAQYELGPFANHIYHVKNVNMASVIAVHAYNTVSNIRTGIHFPCNHIERSRVHMFPSYLQTRAPTLGLKNYGEALDTRNTALIRSVLTVHVFLCV